MWSLHTMNWWSKSEYMLRVLMMLIAALAVGCEAGTKNPPEISVPTPPHRNIETEIAVSAFSFNNLEPTKQRKFNKILPATVRVSIENAPEFTVSVYKRKVVLTDAALRQRLLDSIYWDVANSIHDRDMRAELACQDPWYRIDAVGLDQDLLPERVGIIISYACGKIEAFNKFDHTINPIDNNGISKRVFDSIVEIDNVQYP